MLTGSFEKIPASTMRALFLKKENKNTLIKTRTAH
jgi:hypothetical protein